MLTLKQQAEGINKQTKSIQENLKIAQDAYSQAKHTYQCETQINFNKIQKILDEHQRTAMKIANLQGISCISYTTNGLLVGNQLITWDEIEEWEENNANTKTTSRRN